MVEELAELPLRPATARLDGDQQTVGSVWIQSSRAIELHVALGTAWHSVCDLRHIALLHPMRTFDHGHPQLIGRRNAVNGFPFQTPLQLLNVGLQRDSLVYLRLCDSSFRLCSRGCTRPRSPQGNGPRGTMRRESGQGLITEARCLGICQS